MIVVRADEGVDGDEPVAAGPVVDDHRLAPALAEPVGQQPGADIGAAAGAERDDELAPAASATLIRGAKALCAHRRERRDRAERDGEEAAHRQAHQFLPYVRRCRRSSPGVLAFQSGRHVLVLACKLHAGGERHGLGERGKILLQIFFRILLQRGGAEMALQHFAGRRRHRHRHVHLAGEFEAEIEILAQTAPA